MDPDSSLRDNLLIRYLAAREAPCPRCGYNLHALTVPRCPECGEPMRLRIVPRISGATAWAAMMLAGATVAAPGILITLVAAWAKDPSGFLAFGAGMLLAGGILLTSIILRRRTITARPARGQRGRVLLCWALAALCWTWNVITLARH